MPKLGLIGYPLGYSFSPGYFAEKFEKGKILNWQYDEYRIPSINDFKALWDDKYLLGLNVTIPYKQQVIPFLDELDETAKDIGAVNTIKRVGERLIGYNTDAYGFRISLEKLLGKDVNIQALILGTGGASKAIAYVLKQKGIPFKWLSRSREDESTLLYKNLDESIVSNHQLIINTTPLGTHPKEDSYPDLPYNYIGENHYLMDLVYNPPKTVFLKKGAANGAKTINGLLMLHQQAERSWDIWTNPQI